MENRSFLVEFSVPVATFAAKAEVKQCDYLQALAKRLRIATTDISNFNVIKRSIDARKKNQLKFILRINVILNQGVQLKEKLIKAKFFPYKEPKAYTLPSHKTITINPIIVGSGPAGLFAAYILAQNGCAPIILERGYDVDKRHQDITSFMNDRTLNTESNFLFGEGGAGTYSDGKLYTRSKDPRNQFVLKTFTECGAPEEILYLQRPHIGSDKLPTIVQNLRNKICKLGGSFRWNTCVADIMTQDNKCTGVILANGEKLESPLTILATGHSDRHLIKNLISQGIDHTLKDFQIGCRIEHSQSFVNSQQYGLTDLPNCLGAAEYNIVNRPHKSKIGGVSSFCMCPGGIIIPATNYEGQLSTNGMSNYARDTEFANSALIVNQKAENFQHIQEAFSMLETIEKEAFKAGGSNYTCPAQSAYSFIRGETDNALYDTSYELGIIPYRLDELLPEYTVSALAKALKHFEFKMPGFMTSGTLIGVETHISSPVRFTRDRETQKTSIENLYISGEGAGYASGIMSSAIDGLKIAEATLQN